MSQDVASLNNVQSAEAYLRSELKKYEECGCAEPHVPGQVPIVDSTRKLISDALASMAEDIARRAADDPSDEKLERSLKTFVDCYAKIERINLAKARFEWEREKALQKNLEKNRTADDQPAAERRASVAPSAKRIGRAPSSGKSGNSPVSVRSAEVSPAGSYGVSPATVDGKDICSTTETAKPFVVPPSGGCKRSRDRRKKKRPQRVVRTPSRRQRRAALQAEAAKHPLLPSREIACPENPKCRKPTPVEISNAIEEHFANVITNPTDKTVDKPYSPAKNSRAGVPPALDCAIGAPPIVIPAATCSAEPSAPQPPAANSNTTAQPAQDVPIAIDHSGADP